MNEMGGGFNMRYLKMLSVLLALLMVFPIAASAERQGASARYNKNKTTIQNRNMKDTAASGYKNIRVQESHGRKTVIGVMINRKNVSEVGEKADNVSGNSLEIKNEGSVYARVKMKNTGDVTAENSDTSTASGNQISVQGARGVVNIRADMENRGNVTANAVGSSNVEANAAGNKIEVRGAKGNVRIEGNQKNSAAITAISRANGK